MFCYVLPLSKSLEYLYIPTSKKTVWGAILFIFQHKQTVVKVIHTKLKALIYWIIVGKLDEEVGWWVSGS